MAIKSFDYNRPTIHVLGIIKKALHKSLSIYIRLHKTDLFRDPLLHTVGLVVEFVECESIEQALLANLRKFEEFLVAAINAAQATSHFWRFSVLQQSSSTLINLSNQ